MFFLRFLAARLLMALLSFSWHNPDETWQSVEVAHLVAFGGNRGHLTWEWTHPDGPIRSSLHPLLLFVPPFRLLDVTRLDSHSAVALVPRLIQGAVSAVGDHCAVNFYRDNFSVDVRWFVLVYGVNVYLLYCSSRTLINVLEMSLGSVALHLYSLAVRGRGGGVEECGYVAVIAFSFMMRMTTAMLWLPLVLHHLRRVRMASLVRMVATAVVVVVAAVCVDSLFYRKLVVVPWNFFVVNVVQDVSSQYGREPWHYYVTSALLPILNVSFPFLAWGCCRKLRRPSNVYLLAWSWSLLLLSILGHKEQRFVLPLLPLITSFAAVGMEDVIVKFNKKKQLMLVSLVMVCNLVPLSYLVFGHNVGSTNVVDFLANEFERQEESKYIRSRILFLLPCHHTPFYSHFHHDFPMDFLKCPPSFIGGNDDKRGLDEAEFFFQHPDRWMESNLKEENIPSHVVLYDKTASWTILQQFFKVNHFQLCGDFFQTLIHDTDKYGDRLQVYCRLKNHQEE